MGATIAWLDASREDQRRMREIVNMFAQSESRDELGIGQIRDAFSDLLFPGTSTLHTRARYLLLIPWCYRVAAPKATNGEDLERRAAANERRLIVALNNAGATDGLIGQQVLTKLKTLPSALYWSALETYGIRVGGLADELAAKSWTAEADELVEREPRMWRVPPAPAEFPDGEDSLDLSSDEAAWVKERILSGSPGSLLEVLLLAGRRDWLALPAPWDVPVQDPDLQALLHHARLFSRCIHGAALTYNLAIARRYEQAGLDRVPDPVGTYEARIDDWLNAIEPDRAAISGWQLPDLWSRVRTRNPNIGWAVRDFVETWRDLIVAGTRPDDDAAVKLVGAREKRQKGPQSRLVNERLLRTWSGESGVRPLLYRWDNVARIVTDVIEGLAGAAA